MIFPMAVIKQVEYTMIIVSFDPDYIAYLWCQVQRKIKADFVIFWKCDRMLIENIIRGSFVYRVAVAEKPKPFRKNSL